jgi:hypothetical protein
LSRPPSIHPYLKLSHPAGHGSNEWRNDQWSATLESLDTEDQSLWKLRVVMRVPTLSAPLVTLGGALSQTDKTEALADTLETQFQPVADPSFAAVIETVDMALKTYFQALANKPKLTSPDEVHDAIMSLKFGKAPSPNGIPNRALKHLPQRAILLLVQIFNAILLTHHFPFLWNHARVISVLKPGKDPVLPSSYRPISLLDVIGLMRDEQFGFRPRHSTSLQLDRHAERITRNFGEKRPSGAEFLDVAKTFDTVWIDGLL